MSITFPNLHKLFNLAKEKKMPVGLLRVHALDAFLGNPASGFPAIHVAGTNGKGSTSLKIAKSLERGGNRVGLYSSPHIATFRERISVNGVMITFEEVEGYLEKIFAAIAKLQLVCTFFEVTTLVGFLFFKEKLVDVAVIEVGLGGRLDATNIIKPLFSVITSIDFDHCLFLGKTIEEIAFEKGGIIKEGVPVLLGPKAALPLLQRIAAWKNSPCYLLKSASADFEINNRQVARAVLERQPFKYTLEGLNQTPPCRFEQHEIAGIPVILDVAHNSEAFQALLYRLQRGFPGKKVLFLLAFSEDKEVEECLVSLIPYAHFFIFTRSSSGKRLAPERLAEIVARRGCTHFSIQEDVEKAFAEALSHQILTVVSGTFYIMKEVRRALGIQEQWDPISLFPN